MTDWDTGAISCFFFFPFSRSFGWVINGFLSAVFFLPFFDLVFVGVLKKGFLFYLSGFLAFFFLLFFTHLSSCLYFYSFLTYKHRDTLFIVELEEFGMGMLDFLHLSFYMAWIVCSWFFFCEMRNG
jgi:hypothetical protein